MRTKKTSASCFYIIFPSANRSIYGAWHGLSLRNSQAYAAATISLSPACSDPVVAVEVSFMEVSEHFSCSSSWVMCCWRHSKLQNASPLCKTGIIELNIQWWFVSFYLHEIMIIIYSWLDLTLPKIAEQRWTGFETNHQEYLWYIQDLSLPIL